MSLQQWALPRLAPLLQADNDALIQVIDHAATLSDDEADKHLRSLLGDSPEAIEFTNGFIKHRSIMEMKPRSDGPAAPSTDKSHTRADSKAATPVYAPPPGPPPSDTRPRVHAVAPRRRPHTNPVIEAGEVRARDEVSVQDLSSPPALLTVP